MQITRFNAVDTHDLPVIRPDSRMLRRVMLLMFIILMLDLIPGMGIGLGGGLSGKNIFLYMMVVFIGIRAATSLQGIRLADLDIHVPWMLLIGYATLTWTIVSLFDPTYSAFRGAQTMKNQLVDYYLFMFAFCYGASSRQDYLWLLRSVVVVLFISNYITLIDYLNIPDLGIVGVTEGRVEGLIGGVNQFAGLLAFSLPISIAAMPKDQKPFAKWFWRGGIMATAILLLATGSRGAYLASATGSVYCIFYLRGYIDIRRAFAFTGVVVGIIIVLLLAFAILNPDFIEERFSKSATTDLRYASSGRLDIWTAGIMVMAEWPLSYLVGYGWNSYEYSGIWKSAHNEYLDRFYELGLIGLVIFVVVLRSVRARARKAIAKADPELQRIFIGYVFAIMIITVEIFFSALPDTWTLIWLVTGLIVGLSSTVLEQKDDSGGKVLSMKGSPDGMRSSPGAV